MFTLHRIPLVLAAKPYWIGLLFSHKNSAFGAIGPLQLAIHVVQNRHAGELEQDKQRKIPFKIMYALSCFSATFALQHGGFVPREWLTAKGPFLQRNEAGMCRSLSISNRSCDTLCAKVKK